LLSLIPCFSCALGSWTSWQPHPFATKLRQLPWEDVLWQPGGCLLPPAPG